MSLTARSQRLFAVSLALGVGNAGMARADQSLELAIPQTNQGTEKRKVKDDARLIPLIHSAPPERMVAYLGQTLRLNSRVFVSRHAESATFAVWILNGTLVCKGLTCNLPLDGKRAGPGVASLVLLVYNIHGSVSSRHFIKVLPSSWDPATPLPADQVRRIDLVPAEIRAKPHDPKKLYAQMKAGHAVQAYPGDAIVLGPAPRNFTWRGTVRMAKEAVARIAGEHGTEWYLMDIKATSLNETMREGFPVRRLWMDHGRARVRMKTQAERVLSGHTIETPEARVQLASGMDTFVVREPRPEKKGEWITRIIALSGKTPVEITAPGATRSSIELPPGLELEISSTGQVAPFEKPNVQEVQKLFNATFSIQDLKDQAAKGEAKSDKKSLEEAVERARAAAKEDDFFEVLAALSPVEDKSAELPEIAYLLGSAYRGLYQSDKASKYFEDATRLDEESPEAPWQLAMLYLEESKWAKAAGALDTARSRMDSSDSRIPEYQYYSGVIAYNLNWDFWARDHFTRAAAWEKDLDGALRASAGTFLSKLSQRKPWSLLVPMGVQWDSNPLSLLSSDPLPAEYSSRHLFRTISGAVFTWDPGAGKPETGWFQGFTGSLVTAFHFPRSFSSFDLISGGFEAFQYRRSAGSTNTSNDSPPEISTLRFSENVSVTAIEQKAYSVTAGVKAERNDVSAGLAFEYDLAGQRDGAEVKRDAIALQTGWSPTLLSTVSAGNFTLQLTGNGKYALSTGEEFGHSAGLSMEPAWQLPFVNGRGNLRTSLLCDTSKEFFGGRKLALAVTPSESLSWFFAPWLLSSTSFSFALTREDGETETKTFHKMSASFTLTGIF